MLKAYIYKYMLNKDPKKSIGIQCLFSLGVKILKMSKKGKIYKQQKYVS